MPPQARRQAVRIASSGPRRGERTRNKRSNRPPAPAISDPSSHETPEDAPITGGDWTECPSPDLVGQYLQLGEVTNTVSTVVNNGVVVILDGHSRWTVTRTSWLTIAAAATVSPPAGRHVTMTVNGVSTPVTPEFTHPR
jgi:hypothetical protein